MSTQKDKYIYLTQEWLDKLKWELEFLKNEKRIEIAERLKEAISYWDLSENSEYEDARNEQAQIETRIKEIEAELKNVKIVEEAHDEDKVKIGSIVTIESIGEESEKEEFKVMGTMEADIWSNPPKISNESPVWKAVMGKKAGSKVKVKSLSGITEYKILEIK